MSKKRQSLAEHKRKQGENPSSEKAKAANAELAKQQSNIYGSLFLLGIAIVVTLGVFFYLNREEPLAELTTSLDLTAIPDNSQAYENQGQAHLDSGAPREPYNSNPPTSGPHNERWVTPLGVYNRQMPDDMLIHNLEHGHIWFSYRDENDAEAIALFTTLQQQYADRIVVSYRPENTSRIAAAAWTRLYTADELDAEELEAFIIRYNNQAPESVMGR